METPEQLYKYFLSALDVLSEKQGHGFQSIIAISSGLSDSYVSQILGRKRKASNKAQISIANGLGYELNEFLAIGQRQLEGKDISAALQKNNTNQKVTQKQATKVGDDMDELKEVLQHYKTMLEVGKSEADALREEIKFLREENRELKRSQQQTSEPPPKEGDVEKNGIILLREYATTEHAEFIIDSGGTILHSTRELSHITGGPLIGLNLTEIFEPSHAASFISHIQSAITGNQAGELKYNLFGRYRMCRFRPGDTPDTVDLHEYGVPEESWHASPAQEIRAIHKTETAV